MLYGNIFISKLLRFILRADKHLIQILAHIYLTALDLHSLLKCRFGAVQKMLLIDFHFLD